MEGQKKALEAQIARLAQRQEQAPTKTRDAQEAAAAAWETVDKLQAELDGIKKEIRQARKELSTARANAPRRARAVGVQAAPVRRRGPGEAAADAREPAYEPASVEEDHGVQTAAAAAQDLERRADAEERAEAKRRAAAAIVARAARAARGRGAKPAAAGARQNAAAVHVKPELQPEQPGPVRRRVAAKSAKAEPKQESTQVKEENVSVVVKREQDDSEGVSEQPTRAKRARR